MVDISKHPLLLKCYEVSQAIEMCGASIELTNAVTKSSELLHALDKELVVERSAIPITNDFVRGVISEAEYQRDKWGAVGDDGKAPQDWFWLIGYLAGKALRAHIDGDIEKALHHTISSAAALANWHAAILGKTDMRPGAQCPDAGIDMQRAEESN